MSASHRPAVAPHWLEVVREKTESLRFGVVQIVVHEGRVTLIERTERTKLDAPAPAHPATHGKP